MRKKITIGTTVVITLLCCLITFQVTYIGLHNHFEKQYLNESVEAVGQLITNSVQSGDISEESGSFLTQLTKKLAEVDNIYRSHYIGELDDEALIDAAVAGYVAGTGDDYAAYYNTAQIFNQLNHSFGSSAGRNQIIYNQNLLTGFDTIFMHFNYTTRLPILSRMKNI